MVNKKCNCPSLPFWQIHFSDVELHMAGTKVLISLEQVTPGGRKCRDMLETPHHICRTTLP